MIPSQAFFLELQTPNRYFRRKFLLPSFKPSTADPGCRTRRKQFSMDVHASNPKPSPKSEKEFLHSHRNVCDSLRNLVSSNDKNIPTIQFPVKSSKAHKKTQSSVLDSLNILKEPAKEKESLGLGVKDFVLHPGKKESRLEDLFIKRKEATIKKFPARFGLKLPESVQSCRKLVSKKDFNIKLMENPAMSTPVNLTNLLRTQIKKKTFHQMEKHSLKPSDLNEEYFTIRGKTIQTDEVVSGVLAKPPSKKKATLKISDFLEAEEEIPILRQSFGPSSPYFNLDRLHKRKTQKDVIDSMIQGKKALEGRKTIVMQKISYSEEDDASSDGEEDKRKKEKKMVEEMSSKRFRNLTGETGNAKMRKRKIQTIRKALRESLSYFASLKLDLEEIKENKVFSSKPFEKEGSYEFINAVKGGDLARVKEMLRVNKYLVYDYDFVYLTSLHWAVKRKYFDIAKIIINSGADINAKDIIGRTPLYIALSQNCIDIATLLLYNKASPWNSMNLNYLEAVKTSKEAEKLLHKARKLHILMKMTPPSLRKDIWEKEPWDMLEVGPEKKK